MKRAGSRLRLLLAAILLGLTLLSSCCTTCPKVVPPALSWPAFPDPAGKVTRTADGEITMPLDYWLAISMYAVDVDAIRKIVEEWGKP